MPHNTFNPLTSLTIENPTHFTITGLTWLRSGYAVVALILSISNDVSLYFYGVVAAYIGCAFIFLSQKDSAHFLRILAVSLLIDIGFTGWFLYINDGVMSGWVSVLLFPALVGSLTCDKRTAWLVALMAMLCYAILIYIPHDAMTSGSMPISHMAMGHDMGQTSSMATHIEGMLVTFCISVGTLTGFISHQADLLRRHQKSLVEMHERQLREQQIMAFATLSANTTHRLASPISSISLLLEELEENHPKLECDDAFKDIQAQVRRCETVLQTLVKTTRDYDPDKHRRSQIQVWLQELIGNWWVTRSEVQYQLNIAEDLKNEIIDYDDNVSFALVNLLDNAANACQSQSMPKVVMDVRTLKNGWIEIQLQDNGAGIEQPLLSQFGRQFVDSESGLGIGTTLARAAIQRVGGRITVQENGDDMAGTQVNVMLPLKRLS
ncbi:sensor histidine kinase [Alteromonas sp. a30]|uniref:sensor histidine kinase n=1 Tax=Alteromonas sp. a30 TaxID=2730917 RepID=UPI0022806A83|nr:HAMP domain-containing sensor histidine kinase [Alteromonas sp. a30]MCY7295614.1 HAMP domain-containing histidine kinase [Alteromonas sp. a30]